MLGNINFKRVQLESNLDSLERFSTKFYDYFLINNIKSEVPRF